MRKMRKIIEIDEEKCTGCGECILACAEGALALVDGKARMVGEIYCDGLGACIGECPEGALRIIEREAEGFDEAAVEELLKERKETESAKDGASEKTMACGCPGTRMQTLTDSGVEEIDGEPAELRSDLGHWPIKLQLLGPQAPFLKGADLVLMADCAAVSLPDLHRRILRGRAVAIGCPKLDDLDAHIDRLAEILKGAKPKSLTVLHMEVPCCRGFVYAAQQAIEKSGIDVPLTRIMVGIKGEILEKEELVPPSPAASAG
jgi:NAD-dependent dihydropyrimidine dehydrogenase PreA subunit